MKILPHREAMLLLENVSLEGGIARGTYQFRGDEWFFQGHFPKNPIAPGLILCEIIAQSACVLVRQYATDSLVPYLVGMDHTRFHNDVRPGDCFETECKLIRKRKPFFFFEGVGSVNKKICVKTDFSIALLTK
ncbi:MAG: 3-hydroxyacyl-ACP dehydratase FabZ family protein [Planctomycetia bacterium]|nr:3-hydroxyacyl-ACP dehydratase FabZ family protein [Planctomycetia bacterium]